MSKVEIRDMKLGDAKWFLEIFNDPKFYFRKYRPQTLAEEKTWIKKQSTNRKKNIEWNYTIRYDKTIVWVIGIKIYQHRKYCWEIGYFIAPSYQWKWIATKSVALLEKGLVKKLGLKRIEILTRTKNITSQKVALHNHYKKEWILKKVFLMQDGNMQDAYIFAKTF